MSTRKIDRISPLPDAIAELCYAYRDCLKGTLGEKLVGLYVYGASIFPETEATGDVDFHAILSEALTDAERAGVNAIHEEMARSFPPLGEELDTYYLLLDQVRRPQPDPPGHQVLTDVVDSSWALHREHMLAGRCVILHGPQPSELSPAPTWDEIEEALRGELAYVVDHLQEYPGYGILNLCRLMYSYQTRDVVVSKFASAQWVKTRFPEWGDLIDRAGASYRGTATNADWTIMRREIAAFLDFATTQIETADEGFRDSAPPS